LKSLENLVAVIPYEELKIESLKQRIKNLKGKFELQSLPTNQDKRKEKAFIF
jgi:hypothetical protein